MVDPDSGNWTLRITNAAITTATKVRRGQARALIGSIGSYDAECGDQLGARPNRPSRCGIQFAITRAITPPKTVLPEGRVPVSFSKPTSSWDAIPRATNAR